MSSASSVVASFWPGLLLMIVSEAATLAHIEPFWSWNTPIAWTGFILFADAIVWRARGDSWIRSAPREFVWLAASIPLWLVFEFYNLFIENWHYVGLPENPALRYFGYAWSFATIWPAIFEAADLIACLGASADCAAAGREPPASRPAPRLRHILPSRGVDRRRRGDAGLAARLAVALSRRAGVARVHLPARSDQRPAGRRVAGPRLS